MIGGFLLAKMLEKYEVEHVFGVPGGQTLALYWGILESPKIDHLMFRCERCAGYAAMAYSMIKYKPGVCDATVGPGATHLVPSVAEAWGASIPLIAITSDNPTWTANKWASQSCDQISMLKPFVKASFNITEPSKIMPHVNEAFKIATSGRPGPVHLNIPMDILMGETGIKEEEISVNPKYSTYPSARPTPSHDHILKAAKLILKSKKPVILAGGGVIISQAWDEVIQLSELLTIPVVTTITGKGSIPEDHPLSVGVGGATLKECANKFLEEADLAIIVGCKTGQYATLNWTLPSKTAKIIHIDIDPNEIGRNFPTEVPLIGDAKATLQQLIKTIKNIANKDHLLTVSQRRAEIKKVVEKWRKEAEKIMSSDETPISVPRIIKELRSILPRNAVFICDGSMASFYGAIYYTIQSKGRYFIAPRGMAGIGVGFPLTLGAKIASPNKLVVGMGGDGGFAYSIHELETSRRLKIPTIYIVLNNGSFGWIKMAQLNYFGKTISTDFTELNYAEIAEAFKCKGYRVEKPSELKETIKEAIKAATENECTAIVDVKTQVKAASEVLVKL
ncbi:MAG: thiamine pyrophosphate-binding protein [archaeon GB-1867-005]|nr:thiamine pyrophosphate-binding protein [Candidatus Culexmicrobium cathedralense]